MVRPIYEKPSDRNNQHRALCRIEDAWGCTLIATDPLHPYDWDAYRDSDHVAIIEYKKRSNEMHRYADYMISLKKTEENLRLADGKEYILVVEWTDHMAWTKIPEDFRTYWYVKEGGRKDRGDAKDVEPCLFIPMDRFILLP